RRTIYIKLPEEDDEEGMCGLCLKSLIGTIKRFLLSVGDGLNQAKQQRGQPCRAGNVEAGDVLCMRKGYFGERFSRMLGFLHDRC
ncbi:MAG: hypothetical protein VXW84_07150, partial [Verrucomicrobiota bacterium]|nr:hypothetical protein [Verrucomicrobiota bacterium]